MVDDFDAIDLIAEIMVRNGVPGDVARSVESEVRHLIGGDRMHVSRTSRRERAERDERIRSEFDGRNHRELSRRYALNERHVRRIVR